ncbi:MAG: hypothetical protein K2X87_25445 [Gemmataceae bacterium]|nr:hypothetical protein [Gemmataceae bacterium]
MGISNSLFQPLGEVRTPLDYANEAEARRLQREQQALQAAATRQQMQARAFDMQNAQQEGQSKRRQMAVSMLTGVLQEQDPAKQQELIKTLVPMAQRYDPTLQLTDATPETIKALAYSQVPFKDVLSLQKPDLPPGYRMNPSTGQAGLIPGVDPSFGKKSDPHAMPMAITPYQREYLDIQRERNNLTSGNQRGKPPTGFRWAADGQSLEPIPGGPATQISSELSARLGLAQKFLGEADELKRQAATGAATGPLDYLQGAAGFGTSGRIQRRIADGADALQRMLTGAGMPASEAEDYANRFRVTIRDDAGTLTDKLTNLENVLRAQIQMSTRGRGGIDPTGGGDAAGWSIERID